MAGQSIFQLTHINSPLGDWKNTSSAEEEDYFTLEQLYAEAGKYSTYVQLKKQLPNNWTIRLRKDGYISSTVYQEYSVTNQQITTIDICEIKINAYQSIIHATGDLVFEITNALNSHLFSLLDIHAIKGIITKASYIKKTMRVEMESQYNLFRLYKEVSEQDIDFDVLEEMPTTNFRWQEFKQTLLPKEDALYIPKDSWLDYLAEVQFSDKKLPDHALYGKQYLSLRNSGKRGGFKK
jgi:hypothetical protein